MPTAELATTRPNWRRVGRPALEEDEVQPIRKTSLVDSLDQ
jgi:hypothetical protein